MVQTSARPIGRPLVSSPTLEIDPNFAQGGREAGLFLSILAVNLAGGRRRRRIWWVLVFHNSPAGRWLEGREGVAPPA
jgi:hypothetical protein